MDSSEGNDLGRENDSRGPATIMGQRDGPALGPARPPAQTRLDLPGEHTAHTQKRPAPTVGDDLDLAPIDVIGADDRGDGPSRPRPQGLRPRLDEGLLGGPTGGQVLGLIRPCRRGPATGLAAGTLANALATGAAMLFARLP